MARDKLNIMGTTEKTTLSSACGTPRRPMRVLVSDRHIRRCERELPAASGPSWPSGHRSLTESRQKDNLRRSSTVENKLRQMNRAILLFAIPLTLAAQYGNNLRVTWIEPGGKEILPAFDQFENPLGKLGVIQASGTVDTSGHPFFTPLGANG